MIVEFELQTKPLLGLATIVKGADAGQIERAPQAAGLIAAFSGLSQIYQNDLHLLDAGIGLYDAFYRWARDISHAKTSASPEQAAL